MTQTLLIKLPSPSEIFEAIEEEFRIESVVDNYFDSATIHADGTITINGATHYKWTQTDFEDPIAYDSVVFWEYRPTNSCWHWDFEDPINFKSGEFADESIKRETHELKNFKDL